MKQKIIQFLATAFLLSTMLLVPAVASGQTTCTDCVGDGLKTIGTTAGFPNQNSNITNGNIVGLISTVIRIILFISGAVAVLFVVIGGATYLTAGGNDEQTAKAKKTITNALIGIVIIILSYVIVNVVVNLVNCGFSIGSFVGSCTSSF